MSLIGQILSHAEFHLFSSHSILLSLRLICTCFSLILRIPAQIHFPPFHTYHSSLFFHSKTRVNASTKPLVSRLYHSSNYLISHQKTMARVDISSSLIPEDMSLHSYVGYVQIGSVEVKIRIEGIEYDERTSKSTFRNAILHVEDSLAAYIHPHRTQLQVHHTFPPISPTIPLITRKRPGYRKLLLYATLFATCRKCCRWNPTEWLGVWLRRQ